MNLCLALVGPTGSGKSALALELAERLNGELLCLDSTTVYRGFDVGTAKPDADAQKRVPHHLLNLMEPEEDFNAHAFLTKAEATLSDLASRGKLPIVVGGTFFYLRALQYGMYPVQAVPEEVVAKLEANYATDDGPNLAQMHADLKGKDPASAEKIHPNDGYRLLRALAICEVSGTPPSELQPEPLSPAQAERRWLKYALALPRHELAARIERRTQTMLAANFVEETKALREKHPTARALSSVGYLECQKHLDGKLDAKGLHNEIVEKTRQLAKRQITWLRSDPEIRYVDALDADRIELEVNNLRFAMNPTQKEDHR